MSLQMCFPQCITECFPFVYRTNVFSMVSECFQNRPNTSRMLTSKGFISERLPNAFKTRRIDLEWTELFPHAFRRILKTSGKHSSCSRSIRGVRKAYGTQHLQIFIPNAPIIGRHIRMIDDNYFERAQSFL